MAFKMSSHESSPRIRYRQADHPVTGRVGSVSPIGQSVKFGLKVRSSFEDDGPHRILMWSRQVDWKLNGFVGTAPYAVMSSQIRIPMLGAFPIPGCEPV